MTDIVTLTQLRTQCRLDVDDTAEDALLMLYAEAAADVALGYIGQSETELRDTYGGIPAAITCAVLLMAGDAYANREAGRPVNIGSVCEGVLFYLNPLSQNPQ